MAKYFDVSLADQIQEKTLEEINKMDKLHILLVGKTGVGKSTLVNNLFREKLAATGVGKPVTPHLRRIEKEGVPLVLYDTRGLELDQAVQDQVTSEIKSCLAQLAKDGDWMHCAYYCINANANRIEELEINFIKQLAQEMPVILVLTQAMGQGVDDFKAYIKDLNLPIQALIPVMAADYQISADYTISAFGLDELMARTLEIIPEDRQAAFHNAQQVDIQAKAKLARRWARRYIISSFGVGFTPIPFADASILVPMQVGMLAHITAVFGISMEKSKLVSILAAVGGTGGATFLGRTLVANVVKLIPGVGTMAGGVVSGTTAAVVTSALAMSYIEVLTLIAQADKQGEDLSAKYLGDYMRQTFKARLKRGDQDADFKAIKNQLDQDQDYESAESHPNKKGSLWSRWRRK
ncbi:Uncharacterized conserved protein, DUF697 family [Aerococcus urinaehominis]|uniref:YcjF family protein n=1 Tax=Aerococcus urinaehominis TaxID=128944 RepID=UPI000888CBE0|nr:GTPase [Aerococcus urinaehominis]SDM09487.1 Uncharacterized conserved protein, DUF697 family [Aerococcus urinaehominis]